jgi:hypothetical protein
MMRAGARDHRAVLCLPILGIHLGFRPRVAIILALAFVLARTMAAAPAHAATVDTPACKHDLASTWTDMEATLAKLKGVTRAGAAEKCAVYRRHVDVVTKAREVLSRCRTGHDRDGDLAHMDGALDDVKATIDRECTSR